MIDRIIFKSGPSPQSTDFELETTPITVFVGPNNSGKSQVLVELESWSSSDTYAGGKIVENVLFSAMTRKEIDYELENLTKPVEPGEQVHTGHVFITKVAPSALQKEPPSLLVYLEHLINEALDPHQNRGRSYASLRSLYTARLDGQSRLGLINDTVMGDLQSKMAPNHLAYLFRNNSLREEVRRIIADAFGKYFIIDPTKVGTLRIRLSNRPPHSEAEERGLTDASVAFHGAATPIQETSDGVRAFVGIITSLIAGNPRITLIDEPEAFLHPALAMKLGKQIGQSFDDPKKRLFVSTHSASFLMGCIQSGAPINIVRFTYKGDVGTTRVLAREKLLHLMRNPLLRSTGVLDGLFYESVIVTEADADRAFYQEINERLRTANDGRGIGNCLFINAQNKQTVWDIVKPLRELGIPAVGIVDLDMVKDGGSDFTKIIESVALPPLQHKALSATRSELKLALDKACPGIEKAKSENDGDKKEKPSPLWKRSGGINVLSPADRDAANNYFDQLEEYGVFVVRAGELESWLGSLGVPANKYKWLPRMFQRMGEDPTATNYVKPDTGDVWDFLGRIRQWVDDPKRKGIPG